MVIEDFLLRDLNYGTTRIFKKCRFLEFFQKTLKTYLFHQEAFSLFINRFLFNFHTYLYRFFRVLVHCKVRRTVNDMDAI